MRKDGILLRDEILRELGSGLDIRPFNEAQLNPNSYNLRLANELLVYDDVAEEVETVDGFVSFVPNCLNMAKDNPYHLIEIPEDGLILLPGVLYLGRTVEYTETHKFIPMLEGRSSVGRLGISIHSTAGFGDIGFCGYWTLEISCVQPVRIFPNVEICQIYYHTVAGDSDSVTYDGGKYQHNEGIQPSLLWKEFQKEGVKS